MLGFSAFFSLVPLFPEIVQAVKESPEIQNSGISQERLYDNLSSIYNIAFGIGNVMGPIMGSELTYNYGFRSCTDILAMVSILICSIYFIVSDGSNVMSSTYKKLYLMSAETNNLIPKQGGLTKGYLAEDKSYSTQDPACLYDNYGAVDLLSFDSKSECSETPDNMDVLR